MGLDATYIDTNLRNNIIIHKFEIDMKLQKVYRHVAKLERPLKHDIAFYVLMK